MVGRDKILDFLDRELNTEHFNQQEDTDFNGAWTEGSGEVEKIGLCTNTTFENIEAAEDKNCDLVIVHHGGWERFDKDLLEQKKEAIEEAGITWYIAHQPLDCADDYGVVVRCAEKLGIKVEGKYLDIQGGYHGRYGRLEVSKDEFERRVKEIEPDYNLIGSLEGIEDSKIGIVTGGGGLSTV
ncbi:MAG: Nif3-like dinuclear metal center hexameric protein [Candidatus Nanohaloarchaea archaeon]